MYNQYTHLGMMHKVLGTHLLASAWGELGSFWVDQQLSQCLVWLETDADLKWRQDSPYCL